MPADFFWTERWVYLTVAVTLIVVLFLMGVVNRVAHKRWLGGLVVGSDKRGSTSKATATLWTIVVVWALGSLFFGGGKVYEWSCPRGAEAQERSERVAEKANLTPKEQTDAGLAAVAETASRNKAPRTSDRDCLKLAGMRKGWERFVDEGLRQEYLVLLGFPALVAVASKGITAAKLSAGTVQKTEAVRRSGFGGRLAAATADLYSDDDGTADLGDLQYALFNLLAIAYFFSEFLANANVGLPEIPDTLLGLTSVSASIYVAKKAVERQQPNIDSVLPSRAHVGDQVRVLGSFIGVAGGGGTAPAVTIGGLLAAGVETAGDGELKATVPPGLALGPTKLRVTTAAGIATNEFDFDVY